MVDRLQLALDNPPRTCAPQRECAGCAPSIPARRSMPLLVLASLALQILCAIHVVRSGRPLYWIWLLLIGSYIAVAAYALIAVLPDLRNDPGGRKVARRMLHAFDPARQRRRIEQ